MAEIISFGESKDKGHLHRLIIHPMMMTALDEADRGTGDALDVIEQYEADTISGLPTAKATARAIVRARRISNERLTAR